MMNFTSDLYNKMRESLHLINLESENMLQRAEQSYQTIQSIIFELKEFVLGYTFKDKEEEIKFFKEIKPMFLKELIYYNEIYFFEASKPVGNKDIQLSYYNQIMERIRIFFQRNQALYTYFRTGKTIYDELFFLRENEIASFKPDYSLDMDTKFCTTESFKLSKIQAYEMVYDYFQAAILSLNDSETLSSQKPLDQTHQIWTDSKATLVELAYAIQARGSVDNGKADIKNVVEALQKAFHVDLGNYYGVFTQNIRLRKKNRTVYLDQLKEHLERRMEDLDE